MLLLGNLDVIGKFGAKFGQPLPHLVLVETLLEGRVGLDDEEQGQYYDHVLRGRGATLAQVRHGKDPFRGGEGIHPALRRASGEIRSE